MKKQGNWLVFTSLAILISSMMFGCECASFVQPKIADSGVQSESASNDGKHYKDRILAEYSKRQELQDKFLANAAWLARKTDDSEALEISIFLNSNVYSVINIGSNLVDFDKELRKQPVPLFILMGNEAEESEDLTNMFPEKNILGYVKPFGGVPLMVIDNKGLSKFASALIILHEGKHAKSVYSAQNEGSGANNLEIAREEVLAYEFEMRLLDKVGGIQYANLIEEQMKFYEKSAPKMKDSEAKKIYERQLVAINEIFGDNGPFEANFLWTQFTLETKFRYIDRVFPDKNSAMDVKMTVYLENSGGGLKE